MNYYKDENGKLYAYNDIQKPKPGLVKLAPNEVAELPVPPAPVNPKAARLRHKRNHLLAKSDWTQMPDVDAGPGWLDYRQALRDVPQQEGFPESVVWPEPPTD